MGEAKNKQHQQTSYQEMLTQLSRELSDQGRMIEAGWVGLRLMWLPANASALQLQDMRCAFMAGAQHTFSSLMTILDPGSEEPTPKDLERVDKIHEELAAFKREMELSLKTRGRG